MTSTAFTGTTITDLIKTAEALDVNPECGYCSPFGHEPSCPTSAVEITRVDGEDDMERDRR